MKTKVFWKPGEITDLAYAALEAGLDPGYPHFLQSMKDIQASVLPENRRRSLKMLSQLDKVIVRMAEMREQDAQRAAELSPEPAPVPPHPFDVFMDYLADALTQRILARLATTPGEVMRRDDAEVLKRPETTVTKLRKPRVLILGLLPAQAGKIVSGFGDVIDLRFADKRATATAIKEKGAAVDKIISMRWVDHSQLELVKKRGNYFHITGGMDTLANFLAAYAHNYSAVMASAVGS